MKHGVIYTRVSSDEQLKGMSLNFQREDCLAYAEKKGLQVMRVFEERGESAKFADRPQLIELMEYCRRNKKNIDTLIIWKLDRLSRNQNDYYYLKRTLQGYGISIFSATEPTMEDSNSLSAKVFETFTALQAEMDNTIRTERARRGMEARIACGLYPWRPPLGYRPDPNRLYGTKKSVPDQPDPVLFPMIQKGLRRYSQGGLAKNDLVHYLDELGFAKVRRKKTRPQLVHKMLNEYLPYYAGYVTNPWTGDRIKGQHKAMLTEQEHVMIIAARDDKSPAWRVPHKRENPLFPLRGTVLCPDCGKPYTASLSRGKRKRYAYYHCYHRGCPAYGKAISKDRVESDFVQFAGQLEFTRDSVTAFMDELKKEYESRLQQDVVTDRQPERELKLLEQRRQRIYEMREDGSYDRDEFLQRKARIESDIAAVQARVMRGSYLRSNFHALVELARGILLNTAGAWNAMSLENQRVFQKLCFPGGITYSPFSGFGTLQYSCILQKIRRSSRPISSWARLGGNCWNTLEEELARIAAFHPDHPSQNIQHGRNRRKREPEKTHNTPETSYTNPLH